MRISLLGLVLIVLFLSSVIGLILRVTPWVRIKNLSQKSTFLEKARFSADSENLLTIDNLGELCVWSLSDYKLAGIINDPIPVRDASFSANGQQIVTAKISGFVQIWSLAPLRESLSFHCQPPVDDVRYSEDGTEIYIASGTVTEIRNAKSGQLIGKANPLELDYNFRQMRGGGRELGTRVDGKAMRISVHSYSANRKTELTVDPSATSASINRTGSLIAICRSDGVAELWGLQRREVESVWKTFEWWLLLLFTCLLLIYIFRRFTSRRRGSAI